MRVSPAGGSVTSMKPTDSTSLVSERPSYIHRWCRWPTIAVLIRAFQLSVDGVARRLCAMNGSASPLSRYACTSIRRSGEGEAQQSARVQHAAGFVEKGFGSRWRQVLKHVRAVHDIGFTVANW